MREKDNNADRSKSINLSNISGYLMTEVENCFGTKAFSDFVFICSDGEKIPAHRLICSAYSPVMRAMFNTQMTESKDCIVRVADIDGKTLSEMLRFVYTQEVCNIKELAPKLLYAAEKYGLDELKKLSETAMIENLSTDNALEYFFLSDRFNIGDLLKSSISFIKL